MTAALEARIAGLEARVALLEKGGRAGSAAPTTGKPIADDEELDGEYGDPLLKFDPKKWIEEGGESYAGSKFSQCPSGLLLKHASYLDWSARNAEEEGTTYKTKKGVEKPVAPMRRREAALARGWARRHEHLSAPKQAPGDDHQEERENDDPIPF